ncbi:DNA polymerase III subunit delta' [Photobacterium sp. 1_MG-2023]|uniref:DNA polymerase III subunit delta' n=1 Tax=Photobacterium sp. 1_MG-2023 TaxID=3062646 RepID=UPI0026E1B89F|nr:DNA polymerase III subunit delta' [Photobacterium sp. 1_MG-2023]MDO6705745.1 DNA polymerase III subunit delta' [Photobacterium sp. 1_MG-2023]
MSYPWLTTLWQQWQQLLSQERMHHAMLLVSPAGFGREALVRQLAQTVLCQNGVTESCGLCHSCQLFTAETHPDCHVIRPLEGKAISIDAIRQCNHWAWETSQLGGKRVVVIEQAESMGEAAANALLKTLEEPPANCQFILTTSELDRLLPTINSRCNKWRLQIPSEQNVKRWVESQLMQSIKWEDVRLNGCAPLAVLHFIEQGQNIRHQHLLEGLHQFLTPPHTGLFSVTEACMKDGLLSLRWLSYFLVDCLKVHQGAVNYLIHAESAVLVQQVATQVNQQTLLQQIQALNALIRELESHSGLNHELLITDWLSGFIPAP